MKLKNLLRTADTVISDSFDIFLSPIHYLQTHNMQLSGQSIVTAWQNIQNHPEHTLQRHRSLVSENMAIAKQSLFFFFARPVSRHSQPLSIENSTFLCRGIFLECCQCIHRCRNTHHPILLPAGKCAHGKCTHLQTKHHAMTESLTNTLPNKIGCYH